MLKHIIALLVFSILVLMAMPQAQMGLHILLAAHDWIAEMLKQVFSGGVPGNLIRELLALLAMPLLVGLIPALLYWLAKRQWFPYFIDFVWVTWLIQTAALVAHYGPIKG